MKSTMIDDHSWSSCGLQAVSLHMASDGAAEVSLDIKQPPRRWGFIAGCLQLLTAEWRLLHP